MPITRSELLDVVYRFYPRGVLPYARRLHKGEGGGAEHPLLFLWLRAESGEGLAKRAQLRSGEHQSHAEAPGSGSGEGLAERAQLRSGEHQSWAEARVCA